MTVSIDPSEVRRNEASVKPPRPAGRSRFPLRAVLIGGLGSVGLVAFSVGAFSFFSGLADPRVRSPRIMPVAAKMPDLKDGLPALAPESGSAAVPQTTFNLPRPAAVSQQTAQSQPAQPQPAQEAASEPPAPQLRATTLSAGLDASESRGAPRSESVAQAARTVPPIQNAAVIAEARTAAPIPPAKAETVKAKAGQPSAFASLPPEPKSERTPEPASHEARKPLAAKPAAKAPVQKAAAHKAGAAKPVADGAQGTDKAPPPAASDEGDVVGVIPGGKQIRAGLKAIGGMFGGDSDTD